MISVGAILGAVGPGVRLRCPNASEHLHCRSVSTLSEATGSQDLDPGVCANGKITQAIPVELPPELRKKMLETWGFCGCF